MREECPQIEKKRGRSILSLESFRKARDRIKCLRIWRERKVVFKCKCLEVATSNKKDGK